MVRPTVPIPYSFDSQAFRNAVTFAMQMGTSPNPDRRPKFIKKAAGRQYFLNGVEQYQPPAGTLRLDRDGKPLNPNVVVVQTPDQVIEADCAIEVDRADSDELPVGNFRPTKVIVTVLDDEYARITGARELLYNGDRYVYGYEPEVNGLFDVGVHTMIFYALDES